MVTPDETADYRVLFEELPCPVLFLGAEGAVTSSNGAARKLGVEEIFKRGEGTPIRLRDLNGRQRHFNLHYVPLPSDRTAVLMQDVTELRNLEAENAVMKRADSLGYATAALMHDLSRLLTPVTALTTVLISRLEGDSGLGELARRAAVASEIAATMVRRLMTHVGSPASGNKSVMAGALVRHLGPVLESVAGDEVALKLDTVSPDVAAFADRLQLERALLNLVSNARLASATGGQVTVRTRLVHLESAEALTFECRSAGPHVEVSVTDSGSGIPPDQKEKLFLGFASTRRESGGLGLGLLSVYRFVRECGGGMSVDSEVGRGTTVVLYLPQASSPA